VTAIIILKAHDRTARNILHLSVAPTTARGAGRADLNIATVKHSGDGSLLIVVANGSDNGSDQHAYLLNCISLRVTSSKYTLESDNRSGYWRSRFRADIRKTRLLVMFKLPSQWG
jgi:hypothetical protein